MPEPAFPLAFDIGDRDSYSLGLTKREFFAAIALQGILARPSDRLLGEPIFADSVELAVAISAVRFADALIAALNAGEVIHE
jgi:hypothetical protein